MIEHNLAKVEAAVSISYRALARQARGHKCVVNDTVFHCSSMNLEPLEPLDFNSMFIGLFKLGVDRIVDSFGIDRGKP